MLQNCILQICITIAYVSHPVRTLCITGEYDVYTLLWIEAACKPSAADEDGVGKNTFQFNRC